jgi:hypothetical protein
MKNAGKKGKGCGCGHDRKEKKHKESLRHERKERLKQKGKL